MSVLVTGGAGFIGSYVTTQLLAGGKHVVVYDAAPNRNALDLVLGEHSGRGDLVVEQGEITDSWRLLRLCEQYDIDSAVHLASPLTQDVTANPVLGIRDICQGTATMFEVARERQLRRVVWTSSVAVFGDKTTYPAGPLADDAAHRPPVLYGSCKSLCEKLAERAYAVDEVDSVGLRLSVVYGAGRLRGYMSYPSHVIRAAALGHPVRIAYGRQRLHWQYVEEVAAMIDLALDSTVAGRGRTFNTSGDARTWDDAADVLRQLRPDLDITVDAELDPALADSAEDYDDSRFCDTYAYVPKWSLENGVKATLEAYERIAATHGSHEGE